MSVTPNMPRRTLITSPRPGEVPRRGAGCLCRVVLWRAHRSSPRISISRSPRRLLWRVRPRIVEDLWKVFGRFGGEIRSAPGFARQKVRPSCAFVKCAVRVSNPGPADKSQLHR